MPAKSKSQQRLFGMVHAYNKGELHGSRSLRRRIAALSRRISDEDAKHFAKTKHDGLPEKKAGVRLGDGSIADVRRVISGLGEADARRILASDRTEYRDVPGRLAGRTVAYVKGEPVGFSDIYGVDNRGYVRPSPAIVVAVSEKARGRGLAGTMVRDAVGKVLARVRADRAAGGSHADRLRRFVWRLHLGNESSAHAAVRAGFSERYFRRPHQFRQFELARRDIDSAKRTSPSKTEKKAQVMARPETLHELYSRIPVGDYASMAVPASVRSERRRSFLGSVLYGAGGGAVLGGLGAAGLGAFIANHASKDSGLGQSETRRKMLEAAARLGLWGAGRGAVAGSVVGAGLGVLDKIRG